MITLAEIELAANALSASEKQQLMLFLAARLQAEGTPLPFTADLPRDMKTDWMAEDEAAMRRFHPGE
jgi:hypothetical protein